MRINQERMDNDQLAEFVRAIAVTDRVVASIEPPPLSSQKLINLSLTGEAVRQVVRAVSAGRADPGNKKNSYLVTARFFSGTNELGEIKVDDGWLFLAGGRQYRDTSCKHFRTGDGGVLRKLIVNPLEKDLDSEEGKESGK